MNLGTCWLIGAPRFWLVTAKIAHLHRHPASWSYPNAWSSSLCTSIVYWIATLFRAALTCRSTIERSTCSPFARAGQCPFSRGLSIFISYSIFGLLLNLMIFFWVFRWGAWSISCARLDSVTCVWLWCVRETSWNLSLGNSWSRTSTAMPVRVMSIFCATCTRKSATYSINETKSVKKVKRDGRTDGWTGKNGWRWRPDTMKEEIMFSFFSVCLFCLSFRK